MRVRCWGVESRLQNEAGEQGKGPKCGSRGGMGGPERSCDMKVQREPQGRRGDREEDGGRKQHKFCLKFLLNET